VQNWLINTGQQELCDVFRHHRIDGPMLLQIDEPFARDVLEVIHALRRRKLVRHIAVLKESIVNGVKEKTLDELDEYVMLLESHRIKLVAKLKAIFDRFDSEKLGKLNGIQIEQMLVYMNRPVDSHAVHVWLQKLKDNETEIEFPELVAQYSALFAGTDPDIPESSSTNKEPKSLRNSRSLSPRRDAWGAAGQTRSGDRDGSNIDEADDDDYDDDAHERYKRTRAAEKSGMLDKDIMDIKVLAELKSIFDRFAVDGLITAPETCQALTESGVVCPRREMAQYLRSRKILGTARSVTLFEYMRAFAAIKGMHKSFRDAMKQQDTEHELAVARRRVLREQRSRSGRRRSGGGASEEGSAGDDDSSTGAGGADDEEGGEEEEDSREFRAARRRAREAQRRIRHDHALRRSRSRDPGEGRASSSSESPSRGYNEKQQHQVCV
jgi:hypothetical protein